MLLCNKGRLSWFVPTRALVIAIRVVARREIAVLEVVVFAREIFVLSAVIVLPVVIVTVCVRAALMGELAGLILAARVIAPLVKIGAACVIPGQLRIAVTAAVRHRWILTGGERQRGKGGNDEEDGMKFHEITVLRRVGGRKRASLKSAP